VKYNPFHLLDWNAGILPLLNENFGRLKRLLEKGHAPDHEKGGADEINVTGLSGVLADKQLSDWQVLAEVEVDADCDYVDFMGLDINRDWEYYLDITLKNSSDSNSSYYIFIEGDYTITNYYSQYRVTEGSNISAGRINKPECSWLTPGDLVFFTLRLTKDNEGYFRYFAVSSRSKTSNVHLTSYSGTKTATVSNITSIRIASEASGGIGAGSKFILARPRS